MSLTLYGPLDASSPYYVERGLDGAVLTSLMKGSYVSVTGGYQTGKTSVVMRLRDHLSERHIASAYVDLAPLRGYADETTWLRALGQAVASTLLPESSRGALGGAPDSMAGLEDYIVQACRAIYPWHSFVLLLDEVATVFDDVQHRFFSSIRSLFNKRALPGAQQELKHVLFVFSGSFDPVRLLPSNNSPFDVGDKFYTSEHDFDLESIERLAKMAGLAEAGKQVDALAGGHPYLTNRLLAHLVDGLTPDAARERVLRGPDPNLSHLGRQLRAAGEGPLKAALRISAGQGYPCVPGFDPVIDQLLVMGLVKPQNGEARIRCSLYADFLSMFGVPAEEGENGASDSLVDYVLPASLREHCESLLNLAEELVSRNQALAAVCVGVTLEAALVSKLRSRGDLSAAVTAFNEEVAEGKLDLPKIAPSKTDAGDWVLAQMIEVARHCGLVTKPASQVAQGIRDWRNLVHPRKFATEYAGGAPEDIGDVAVVTGQQLLRQLRAAT